MNNAAKSTSSRSLGIKILLNIAALGLAALATGCGGLGVQDDWEVRASLPPLPAQYVEVPTAELPSICGVYANGTLHGCAKRDFKRRVCTIVTGPQPAAWLLEHERKHCAGYDHGPVNTAGIRTAALSHGSHSHDLH